MPLDVPPGPQPLIVSNGDSSSEAFSLTVAPTAPAIFFYPAVAIVKSADYSLVSDANPAHAGDTVLVMVTGLGQTTPPLATGQIVPVGTTANTAPVTATIAGRSVTVTSSTAYPLYPGLYQVAITVPAGVIGTAPLVVQIGGVNSNSVNITVR